jgi:Ca-activated chloride channel family protein
VKRSLLIAFFFTLTNTFISANGVVFNTAKSGSYLSLTESNVYVTIENQVANTITTQIFKNTISDSLSIKYAFPLPEGASATALRYKINGIWHTAIFSPVPQDTTTGGDPDNTDIKLKFYLGNNPLYFEIDQKIAMDSTIIIELTYVELLKYKFGKVKYIYPNNYKEIQSQALIKQNFNLTLNSERTIEDVELLSHNANEITNDGNTAIINYTVYESPANADYYIQYNLSLNELGLFSLSTYIPDSLQKDSYGRGFFSFIVEPDPSENTEVIDKVFTLIIDNSGSMSGEKIIQARDAATFIVENLNPGDKFNIISFSTFVRSFRPEHVDYNVQNQEAALVFINSLSATNSTNISGAFDVAIPQFSIADPGTANIIIFFTDGEQTAGIKNTDELIKHIDNLIIQSEKQISLFTFGIGSFTNERLLTTIATHNNGASEFLKNNELEEVITDFYLMIKNPVLLNTNIAFSPSIIRELYPVRLPNLYKGQQMVLVGRYIEPDTLKTKLTGNAYANDVEYTYTTNLSDSNDIKMQFLTKIWAKSKIDYLMDLYYVNSNYSHIADSIKSEVIKLSIDYGVFSPFTSFQGGNGGDGGGSTGFATEYLTRNNNKTPSEHIEIKSLFPNPCKYFTNLKFITKNDTEGKLTIDLVNAKGQLIFTRNDYVHSNSNYNLNLDFVNFNLKKGVYYIVIKYKTETISSKIVIE